jgi:transposase
VITTARVGRVFAHAAPTDLRKGFDGLAALVVEHLGRQATSGDLYLFVSRDRLRAKVLWWDGTGLCIHAKRLEQGRFAALWGRLREGQVELSAAELALFLEGCREVGRRPLSPPLVDPNRKLSTVGRL